MCNEMCNEFQCVYEADNVCQVDINDGECIGEQCGNWGECINCQQQDKEEYEGFKNR